MHRDRGRRQCWLLAMLLLLGLVAQPAWLPPPRRREGLLQTVAVLWVPQVALAKEAASAKDASEELPQLIRFADNPALSGWQIRLPSDWITVRKEAPTIGSKAESLLFSGGPLAKSEIKILRVPLKSKSDTMGFFLDKSPAMSKAKSRSKQPRLLADPTKRSRRPSDSSCWERRPLTNGMAIAT
ncbi:unnamed protein product [Symbiodinium natans]|uniref:Plastid lipid-associated protein/fibrillin conserved domain-containing protein n=1 Tax=Symbiodinium natans TaxID=878477 RepID=A0A812RIU5_9DINO|nr:unnamed protein product [Symbiodinium natans]